MRQQLLLESENVPTDASQVCSSTSMPLNREEILSVAHALSVEKQVERLDCNNPEVNLPQHTVESKSIVYVLSVEGEVLMPCKPATARKLLKKKLAKVVKLYPFTIQLNFECENKVQIVELGMDSGYGFVGFSCVTDKKELACGTLILEDKTSERLTERRMYRRNRKARHHWYRKPRFNNRTKSKKEGWLPPSTQRRYDAHLQLISLLKSILPISETTIEVGKFDIAKIENPDISGVEYQQGDMYGYQNMRAYLMAREGGKCQLCKEPFTKSQPSHIHHCKQRNEAGSDRAENLAILHKKCHTKLHKENLKLPAPKEYKGATFMSIIRKRFMRDLPDANFTYGNITFVDRNKLGLEKTHYNDAFVIAGGTSQERISTIEITQKRRNCRNIQLNRKGFAPSVRKQRYAIRPKDLVWIDGNMHRVVGIQNKGAYVKVENSKKVFPTKSIERKYHFGSFTYN